MSTVTILSAVVVGFCCGYLFSRHLQTLSRNQYNRDIDKFAALHKRRRELDIKDWEKGRMKK